MAERIVSTNESEPTSVARLLYPNKFVDLMFEYYDNLLIIETTHWQDIDQKREAIVQMRRQYVANNVQYLSVAPDKSIFYLVELWDDPADTHIQEIKRFGITPTTLPQLDVVNQLKQRVASRGNELAYYGITDVWDATKANIDGFDEAQKSKIKEVLDAVAANANSWRTQDR